jgi:hypothetical protein
MRAQVMNTWKQNWGEGIVIEIREKECLAQVVESGAPATVWPPVGGVVACLDNGFQPASGQLWLISYDAGIYFMEELQA